MVRSDQQRVRSLLAEAITILCKNCLAYKQEFTVEGLLGITLDQDEVFLVNIKENITDGSGGADPQTMGPEFLQPEQLLGLNQQHFIHAQPHPPRPMRVLPVSRPFPAKSPFMPKRTFGNYRGRGRGRGRGRHPVRPPSRQISSNDHGPPPEKRPNLDIPIEQAQPSDTEPIEIKEEDDENSKEAVDQNQDNGMEDSGQTTGSKSNDALVSLDFGDMLQQYEDASSNLQDQAQEDNSMTQDDDTAEDSITPDQHKEDILIIKPDPEAGSNAMTSPSQTNSTADSIFSSSPMDSAGAMFHGAQSGPIFPGSGPGQFMDPTMPSFSAWGQQQVPSTQSMSGYTPRSKPNTPRKSGPGRPSAAAGSPAQGGSPQSLCLVPTRYEVEPRPEKWEVNEEKEIYRTAPSTGSASGLLNHKHGETTEAMEFHAANGEVLKKGRKRKPYFSYDAETKAEIGAYSCHHGIVAAVRYFSRKLGHTVSQSTVRSIKLTYQKANKMPTNELPHGNRGKPLKLDSLDTRVQQYVQDLYNAGGSINKAVVIAAARGIVESHDPTLLTDHGGNIKFTKSWARSVLERINLVNHRGPKTSDSS